MLCQSSNDSAKMEMTQQKVVLIISDLKEIASNVRLKVGSKSGSKTCHMWWVRYDLAIVMIFHGSDLNFGLRISLPPKYKFRSTEYILCRKKISAPKNFWVSVFLGPNHLDHWTLDQSK